MNEIELKFQVPARSRNAVDAAVAGRAPARRIRLRAAYCDTPQRTLAQAGLALRVRREGRLWVQTLKGPAADGMTRLEHNVPLGVATTAPAADPARHAGTELGRRLLALLAAHPDAMLGVRFRTDVLRRTRLQREPRGRVELAFDEGYIAAGDAATARLALCELEVELKGGSPLAVIDTARRWLPRFGLWLDSRSKAERGDLLASGQAMAPPCTARDVVLSDAQTLLLVRQQVLRSCADQIIPNACQIASGKHADEHVHQLRVGLRRLRTALRLFEATKAMPAIEPTVADAAATLFRALGPARDQGVIEGAFGAGLAAALAHAGVSADAPRARAPQTPLDLAALIRGTPTQMLLLDLLALNCAPLPAAPEPDALRERLAAALDRWHRRAVADARRYAGLDDVARHVLRKRIKGLRYAVEFCAMLFPRRAVRRYLRPLRELQERLGAINDVVMAMQSFKRLRETDPHAWFALGWLAARCDVLVEQARPELKAFARVQRFWKRA